MLFHDDSRRFIKRPKKSIDFKMWVSLFIAQYLCFHRCLFTQLEDLLFREKIHNLIRRNYFCIWATVHRTLSRGGAQQERHLEYLQNINLWIAFIFGTPPSPPPKWYRELKFWLQKLLFFAFPAHIETIDVWVIKLQTKFKTWAYDCTARGSVLLLKVLLNYLCADFQGDKKPKVPWKSKIFLLRGVNERGWRGSGAF